jgi:hypothetical protein
MSHQLRHLLRSTLVLSLLLFSVAVSSQAQAWKVEGIPVIPLPQNLPQGHPRLLTTASYKPALEKQISKEAWAKELWNGIVHDLNPYLTHCREQPDWLLSRLLMYWKSRATQVYIKGGKYAYATGEAPVPTPRFDGGRGITTSYRRPALADIMPYMDDTKGIYFRNVDKPGSPLEWGELASDQDIGHVNHEIMGIAANAAFVYWVIDDEEYARLAFDVFDTYMTGMYYRKEPIDLLHGLAQNIVGLSTFEVIQERILRTLAICYDFLYPYISRHHSDKLDIYAATFKKWVDIIIKNGVPKCNWNLFQAGFILPVAAILEDNDRYTDGKGRQYYINYVLNVSSYRQYSIPHMIAAGYDPQTAIWMESPGYALEVVENFALFFEMYDNMYHQNLLEHLPMYLKAVTAIPQYLFPNGETAAFGDTRYALLHANCISTLIRLAQKYKDKELEERFTRMYKLFVEGNEKVLATRPGALPKVPASFFTGRPFSLDPSIPKGELSDYLTPVIYSPNVSWIAQRHNYTDKQHGLMISLNASLGDHSHSNGINMELYGKGFVLGPDPGIGSFYFNADYLEYYSQFPAHNTVMVDGISKYPEMNSFHPFEMLACYPASGVREGYCPDITFTDLYFLEPESRSDQRRLMSIVSTDGNNAGYYVDIFRSRKQRGGDKYHDYYYHNLGQTMSIRHTDGTPIPLQPTEEMAYFGEEIFALDYLYDKHSARTARHHRTVWEMTMPDSNHVYMNLWMKGDVGREVFSLKAPPATVLRGDNSGIPYDYLKAPMLTFAARQYGEAWNHPFVSIYEPTTVNEQSDIRSIEPFTPEGASPDFVGLIVTHRSGRKDYIFSSVTEETIHYADITVCATYAVVSRLNDETLLFMGHGTLLRTPEGVLSADGTQEKQSTALKIKKGQSEERYSFYRGKH